MTLFVFLLSLAVATFASRFPTRYNTGFLDIIVGASTYDVLDYGAKGDGKTDDTKAVQSCINAAMDDSSGGTVLFPDGYTFLLYPIISQNAKGNVTFMISGTILLNDDISSWTSNYGESEWWEFKNINNFVLTGKGTIDGQGSKWWQAFNSNSKQWRPRMIYCYAPDTHDILISDITFKNSPKEHIFMHSYNVEIKDTSIEAPLDSPNTDAIDPAGNNFYIHNNYISVGDDNVAIKSGNNSKIEHNTLGTGHGLSIGGLNGGWITNITMSLNNFYNTTNGFRIKSDSGSAPGRVWDIYFQNNYMNYMDHSITIDQFYGSGDTKTSYLYIDHITIKNLTSHNSQHAGEFQCQPSTPCKDIYLSDIDITEGNSGNKLKAFPFVCENACGTASNVTPESCLSSC